jgi:DNA polymerase-3 subunit delta
MTEISYKLLKKYLKDRDIDSETQFAAVYLIFGEELLVKTAFDGLLDALLPGSNRSVNYDPVDGTVENIYDVIERVNTFSLLPGAKVVAMRDSRIFYTKQDKSHFLENSKKAFVSKDIKKAATFILSLLGRLNLTFEDVGKSNRSKTLKFDVNGMHDDEWLDEIIRYCQENQLTIPKSEDESGALQKAIEKGFPKNNHLIITTDLVDKRRGLYKAINNQGMIIDCSVPKGDHRASKLAQEDVLLEKVSEILKPSNKKMDKGAYLALVDMTGFDLRTFCSSLEKLVNYVGKRDLVTVEDVESVLERSKIDPIYDLTNAVSNRQTDKALFFLGSILSTDFHPLQVLAAIANQMRKMLLAKDFLESPQGKGWHAGLSFSHFQKSIMPAIVAHDQVLLNIMQEWESLLSNKADFDRSIKLRKGKKKIKIATDLLIAKNPKNAYPVYQLMKKSERFSKKELIEAFNYLDESDALIKSSGQNQKLILERLIFKICNPQRHIQRSRQPA